MNKTVLLINAEGVQTICLARSLRKLGCKVIGFCNHRCSSGYFTRYLSERHKTPDITQHPIRFESFLFSFLKKHQVDLIIPLADDGADFLSRNKESIERHYNTKCAIPSYDTFVLAGDKQYLMQICERFQISHPKTRPLPHNFNDDSEIASELKDISDFVGFPSLIKPNRSQGAKGIQEVHSIQELKEKLLLTNKIFGPCSLQQYVEQPDYYYNVMLYRDGCGNMDYFTVIKIRRFFPLKGGSSCYCETVKHDGALLLCKTLLDTLSWKGFADIDLLEDKATHELKIIEVNPRVPSSFQAAFASNIDFGKVFLADVFNEPMPAFEYKTGMQIRWLGLDMMWFLFSKERLRFKPSWFKFFGKDVSYQDGAWNDPLPMFTGLLSGIIKYLNPEFRRAKLGN